METKDDVGVGVKIINGNDAIEILKVMSKDTKIYEVSPILVELINSNINLKQLLRHLETINNTVKGLTKWMDTKD